LVGKTCGFSRDGKDFYQKNSTPKNIWLRELHKDARSILKSSELPEDLVIFEKSLPAKRVASRIGNKGLTSLFRAFKNLPDTRRPQGRRFSLGCCMSILLCSILAGCKGFREYAEFAKTLSQPQLRALRSWKNPKTKKYEAPTYSTLWRAASLVDAETFEEVVNKWFRDSDLAPEAIALDGKALRGTRMNEEGGSFVISAVSHSGSPFFLIRPSQSPKGKK
jgi:hypothetical protein